MPRNHSGPPTGIPNSTRPFAPARHKHSSSLQLLASNFWNLIGTPERLETRLSHRKQTTAYPSNRYTSRPPVGHSALRPGPVFTSHHSPVTTHAFAPLPETPNRVETPVSCRKQTAVTCSTRDRTRAAVCADGFAWGVAATARALRDFKNCGAGAGNRGRQYAQIPRRFRRRHLSAEPQRHACGLAKNALRFDSPSICSGQAR
jgi:hypothetical protein